MYKLLLTVLLLGACAPLPEDPNESEDGLEEEEAFHESARTACPQGRCQWSRGAEGSTEIDAKYAQLPPDLVPLYFARATSNVLPTPAGDAYHQWFAGSAGRGSIYNVRPNAPVSATVGTFYIYGAILEEWVRTDYERGLGYFVDPERVGGEVHQVFGIYRDDIPSIANHGHLSSRGEVILRVDGSIWRGTREEYLNGNSSSNTPQSCELYKSYSLDGTPQIVPEVGLEGSNAQPCGPDCVWILWCGAALPTGYESLDV